MLWEGDNMRVLVLAPHYTTFVKGLTEAISRHVDYIDVFVHHNWLAELARYLPFTYFRHVKKFSRGNIVDIKSLPSNVKVHVVSTFYFMPDGKNIWLGDKLVHLFRDYIEKNNIEFDLVHAHFTWPSGYTGVKLAMEFGVPVVVTSHGYDIYELPFKDKKWFELIKYTLSSADCVCTVSRSNMSVLTEKLSVPHSKVFLAPNGFDPELFRPMDKMDARSKLSLPVGRKIVLNVANLVPVKGHRYLLEAMKRVIEHRKDVLLVIVGGGFLEKEIRSQVRAYGLEGYVLLKGTRPHSEIPLWMNAADIFALSSLREGNPTVMFEALGVGLPFVGTAVGGVPEIITSEDYGLICPPKNSECLAEKILIALEREWDKKIIIRHARQFTWSSVANKYLEAYTDVIFKKRL